MLRRGVTASGTNEAANLGIWGRNPVNLGFVVFYMVGWPAGIPFWAFVAPDFGGWPKFG